MKILVIERTIDQNWRQVDHKDIFDCPEHKMMETFIQEYKEKKQISEDIEFIFLKGTNCGGAMAQWRCYHEDSVLTVIHDLIHQGEIDGLLLDPILTEDEEEKVNKLIEILESKKWVCFCEEGWIVIPLVFGKGDYDNLVWDYKEAKKTVKIK